MPTASLPPRSPLARHWTLDPDVVFLNHGSFGATPTRVLERQSELRARLERQPVRFLARELESLLDEARAALAAFVGADPADLGFVHNATTAVNAVVGSLAVEPGDELLRTTHEYNACSNVLDRYAARAGAHVVLARVPFPVASEDEVVEAVLAAVTPRTRLALIDHVTSPTGLVLPVERLARELSTRGVPVLVDGAHAPGMVDVDLSALGEAGVCWYAANWHKWICAPKGSGLLWVRPDVKADTHPAVTSHGANSRRTDRSRFLLEFDWQGTQDPTAWLSVPEAIATVGGLVPGGWPEVRARNRALALAGRALLCDALGISAPSPDAMIGSLASVPLPLTDHHESASDVDFSDDLADALRREHGIEVPVFLWREPRVRLLRISAQLYNDRAEYAYLADALRAELTA